MPTLQQLDFRRFRWVSITDPTEEHIKFLREEYNLHPLSLKECLEKTQRSKIDMQANCMFMILLWPKFSERTKEISMIELDVFIGKTFLITLSRRGKPNLQHIFAAYHENTKLREQRSETSPERLLYEILHHYYQGIAPLLNRLDNDCDQIEREIFGSNQRRLVSDILYIRRATLDTRRVMQAHKNLIKRLIGQLKDSPIYMMKKTDVYFESLLDHAKEVWDQLENFKERSGALQQTNESQISFQLSDTMRMLTIISVMTFPLTLIAAVFAMDALPGMPLADQPGGFWIVLGIMATVAITMVTTFKRKGWL